MKESKLKYDKDIDRFVVDGYGLHCGDTMEVLLNDKWVSTRIEYDYKSNWYLVGLRGLELEGLTVRIN